MKNLIPLLVLLLSMGSTASAQEWLTDFDTAREIAYEENRPIVLVFKGSDWCAPCIKLDKEVFNTEEFKSYAVDHFVMLEADFPKRKKNALPEDLQNHNNELAEKYNKQGVFPFVVVLNKDGKVIGETGYFKSTPSNYISHLEAFKG